MKNHKDMSDEQEEELEGNQSYRNQGRERFILRNKSAIGNTNGMGGERRPWVLLDL